MGGIKMLSQSPPLEDLVKPLQLRQTKRGRKIAHARLVGCRRADNDRRPLLQTVRAVAAQSYRDIDIIRYTMPLTACQRRRLRKIKDGGIAERPTSAP